MKMRCECDRIIADQTDCLPFKGHFIAEQDYSAMWEELDRSLAEVADGRLTTEDAWDRINGVQIRNERLLYQCDQCGTLLVEDWRRHMNLYGPATATTSKHILRGEPRPDDPPADSNKVEIN